VRPIEPILALVRTFGRDARDLVEQRFAFGGGLAGVVITGFALWGAAAIAHADDATEPVPEDIALEFLPGSLARLGSEPTAKEASGGDAEPPVAQPEPITEPPTPPPAAPETVTSDHDAAPAKPQPPRRPDTGRPRLPTDDHASDDPSHSGGRRPGPPSVDDRGNPWGDPEGWDDLTRDGDPWATSVVKALEDLPVGWYAGKPAPGDFRFRISVCKDGKVSDVVKKGGTMARDGQDAVLLALEQLELPPIPKHVADRMPSRCARIDHLFVWSGAAVK
jgi:hypothetical protein